MSIPTLEESPAAGAEPFPAESDLLAQLQRIAQGARNVRIALPGRGSLDILPKAGVYCPHTVDLPAFCRAPADQYSIERLNAEPPGYELRSLDELMWQVALFTANGRLLAQLHPTDLLRLHRWPNLTRLPMTPNTMRICALLARHAVTILLVPRILRIAREEAYTVCSAALSAQAAHVVTSRPGAPAAAEEPAPANSTERLRGFIGLLLDKLSRL
jgi:hypothetical protein